MFWITAKVEKFIFYIKTIFKTIFMRTKILVFTVTIWHVDGALIQMLNQQQLVILTHLQVI